MSFEDFGEAWEIHTPGTTIFLRKLGTGPGLLLLHGFPETHLMWRAIALLLADRFTVICPDLRGYGRSGCPSSDEAHMPYSKRAMAEDMVSIMDQLGFPHFCVAGHDRGGRVAYRLALDHSERIDRLAVLDIVPVAEAWDRADKRLAMNFWPWALLSQPSPLPERLIAGAPDAVIEDAFAQWGSDSSVFPSFVREAYVEALRDPVHVHAICEEFRAAATVDYEHDLADRRAGRRINCPVLVMWSAGSALDTWYTEAGGPLGVWRIWANDVQGQSMQGGHFFPEELPKDTADRFADFFVTF
jgi:haloacetate dehalogenase